MLHRILIFKEQTKVAVADLSFSDEVPADQAALMNTVKALVQFSRDTAQQTLQKLVFARNQQSYSASVY